MLRLLCLVAGLVGLSLGVLRADDASDREYKVKAAFVYNFLKFVEGGRFVPPPEKKQGQADANNVLIVGIVGVPPSKAAFEELKGKQVANRPVVLHWFRGFAELANEDKDKDKEAPIPERHPDLDRIRKCHVLFVCPSEAPFLNRLLPHLRDSGILTVADVPGFLESGGVINLLIEEKKVRFEINLAAAARAKLVIRSSLLRLAVRTIERDELMPQEEKEDRSGSGRP